MEESLLARVGALLDRAAEHAELGPEDDAELEAIARNRGLQALPLEPGNRLADLLYLTGRAVRSLQALVRRDLNMAYDLAVTALLAVERIPPERPTELLSKRPQDLPQAADPFGGAFYAYASRLAKSQDEPVLSEAFAARMRFINEQAGELEDSLASLLDYDLDSLPD